MCTLHPRSEFRQKTWGSRLVVPSECAPIDVASGARQSGHVGSGRRSHHARMHSSQKRWEQPSRRTGLDMCSWQMAHTCGRWMGRDWGGATGQRRAAAAVAEGAVVSHLVARLEHRLRRGVLPKRRLVEQQRAPHRQRRAQPLDERRELEREVEPSQQRREQPALRANGGGSAALGVRRSRPARRLGRGGTAAAAGGVSPGRIGAATRTTAASAAASGSRARRSRGERRRGGGGGRRRRGTRA